MPLVQLIYRKPNPLFFSIEKVFSALMEKLTTSVSVHLEYMPFYSSSISNMVKNIQFVKKNKADIYHITGDVHYVAMGLPANKTILTIHDSVFLRESKGLKRIFFTWIFLKLPVRRCRYVTTISEKSKKEILEYTGCEPSKVKVIPNPVNDHIYFSNKDFNAVCPTLLFIGSTPNKNLDRMIAALDGINCRLEIVGRIPEAHEALLKAHKINFRQVLNLSEKEMADRYSSADIIVFPSLYEGFGLPILESQKAGRVVLTSNLSPMKEVAGEGACLIDPMDMLSIRNGLKRIIDEVEYREDLIKKGLENVHRYNTQAIADQYLKLYSTILES